MELHDMGTSSNMVPELVSGALKRASIRLREYRNVRVDSIKVVVCMKIGMF